MGLALAAAGHARRSQRGLLHVHVDAEEVAERRRAHQRVVDALDAAAVHDEHVERIAQRRRRVAQPRLHAVAVHDATLAAVDGLAHQAEAPALAQLLVNGRVVAAHDDRRQHRAVVGQVLGPRRRVVARHDGGRHAVRNQQPAVDAVAVRQAVCVFLRYVEALRGRGHGQRAELRAAHQRLDRLALRQYVRQLERLGRVGAGRVIGDARRDEPVGLVYQQRVRPVRDPVDDFRHLERRAARDDDQRLQRVGRRGRAALARRGAAVAQNEHRAPRTPQLHHGVGDERAVRRHPHDHRAVGRVCVADVRAGDSLAETARGAEHQRLVATHRTKRPACKVHLPLAQLARRLRRGRVRSLVARLASGRERRRVHIDDRARLVQQL